LAINKKLLYIHIKNYRSNLKALTRTLTLFSAGVMNIYFEI